MRAVAVLTDPLTIAEKALGQIYDVRKRLPWACKHDSERGPQYCHRPVVIGAGPIGLLGTMNLVLAGLMTFVYSKSATPNEKADLVDAIGATYVAAEECSMQELATRTGKIDAVYEAAGASPVAFDVLEHLGTNGDFVLTGIPGRKSPTKVNTDLLMRHPVPNNQVVFGTVNAARSAYESAIAKLAAFDERWGAWLRDMITGRYDPEDIGDLLKKEASGIKNVMSFTAPNE